MKRSLNTIIIIITLLLLFNIHSINAHAQDTDITELFDVELTNQETTRIYFVIGIGFYIHDGTWPVVHEISPIFMLKIGFFECKFISFYHNPDNDEINFIEGDKFFGYSPNMNIIKWSIFRLLGIDWGDNFAIGLVYGIWIDKENHHNTISE